MTGSLSCSPAFNCSFWGGPALWGPAQHRDPTRAVISKVRGSIPRRCQGWFTGWWEKILFFSHLFIKSYLYKLLTFLYVLWYKQHISTHAHYIIHKHTYKLCMFCFVFCLACGTIKNVCRRWYWRASQPLFLAGLPGGYTQFATLKKCFQCRQTWTRT